MGERGGVKTCKGEGGSGRKNDGGSTPFFFYQNPLAYYFYKFAGLITGDPTGASETAYIGTATYIHT